METDQSGGPPKRQEGGKLLADTLPSSVEEQTMPFSRKATKRRHTGIVETIDQRPFFLPEPKVETRLPGRGERKVPLLVKDWDAQQKWFGEAFKAVQQVGCRTIAKVWIKKIHPKKVRSSHQEHCTAALTPMSNRLIHTMGPCHEIQSPMPAALDRLTGPMGL